MGTPYRECPNCGAHLDAGELCDCRRTEREPRRPEQEPRKPMRLMAICREIDKDTGRIAVYPLKMEIDDRILGALKVRATMNPELRYFVLVSARWEKYGTVIAGILKRRSVTPQTAYNLDRLVTMSGLKTPGRVVDKLVREKMLALRGHTGGKENDR